MPRTSHVCTGCGHEEPRWHGRCPGCAEWNTLSRSARRAALRAQRAAGRAGAGRAGGCQRARDPAAGDRHRRARPGARRGHRSRLGGADRRRAGDRQVDADQHGARQPRGRRPPDALRLGGGVDRADALRAQRLAGSALAVPAVAETDLETVVAMLERERPEVCVIDSVQTLDARELSGAPGSVGQVREVAARIVGGRQAARRSRCCSSVTSRRTARSPGRACSSTSSTACCVRGRARVRRPEGR